MRSSTLPIAALLLAASVSCGRSDASDARLSDDLEQDLAKASASALELANGSGSYQPMRFVSAIEQVPQAEPERKKPQPKPTVRKNTSSDLAEEKAPEPEPEQQVATPVAEQPQVTEEAESVDVADAPRVPIVAPRPAPVPVEVPSSGGSGVVGGGRTEGPDWGDVVGVVLRGGRVDPGHCPPRRPRGRGLPFPIPHDHTPPVLRPTIHP